MDKRIDNKVKRISGKHSEAVILDGLDARKEDIYGITIVAGAMQFNIPSRYYKLFIPVIEQMKQESHKLLVNELKAQEEYDG